MRYIAESEYRELARLRYDNDRLRVKLAAVRRLCDEAARPFVVPVDDIYAVLNDMGAGR